jgi:ABC-type dipeptide/oligopeptide/nickel transport system permease subunit
MFSFMGGAGQALILVIVFAIVGWPGLMRFVRSLSLSMREQQFVEAARTVGSSHWKIIYRHLLPNMWGLILVQASFAVVGFIYTEAILSLFGLGVKEPNPDLGKLLIDGTSQMGNNDAAWIFPSLFLTILILAFTFLGDGIRDAVDPRSRG